jgi:UDP-2,3-diacylglucosamine hydrolase
MRVSAPAHWRCVDIISDVHLQPAERDTFLLWQRYLRETPADAVFILGDLFEAWVGDDAADAAGFAAECAEVLRQAGKQRPLFFMHGNRDFLVGSSLMQAVNATLLQDPAVLGVGERRWLLTHGDALCLADTDYLRFREQVRSSTWQRDFLALPLAQREQVARHLRSESEARKLTDQDYADVDHAAADVWLDAAQAGGMIHGHTHRPAEHVLPSGRPRIVLSDWDGAARPPRAEALRLHPQGYRRVGLI